MKKIFTAIFILGTLAGGIYWWNVDRKINEQSFNLNENKNVNQEVNVNTAPTAGEDEMIVKIFASNQRKQKDQNSCEEVFDIERVVPKTLGVARASLNQLFGGLTDEEKSEGYTSWFSEATKDMLLNIKIIDNVAYVDLKDYRDKLNGANSSCGIQSFFGQVDSTLKQFPTIKKVIYAIDGNPETFYEWMQLGCSEENNNCDKEPFKSVTDKSDLIKVSLPAKNSVIDSPLIIKGEARGYWFFEASFPVELKDVGGKVIASGIATAQNDWMTDEFVPFEAKLDFNATTSGWGKLILKKDNPSGLAKYGDQLVIPVQIVKSEIASWVEYVNDVYHYKFKHPKTASVQEASKDAFTLSVSEEDQGVTIDQKYEKYSGKICLSINTKLGYIYISAPENKEFAQVNCGRTGVGYDIKQKTETVNIAGKDYVAKGYEELGPGETLNFHNETMVLVLDDGTRIEYGARPIETSTYEDYLAAKSQLIKIVQTYQGI